MTTQEQMNDRIVSALGDVTDALRAVCDRIDQVNNSTAMANEHLAEIVRVADGAGLVLSRAFIDEDGEPILDGIQFGILNQPIHLPAEGDEDESSFILASDIWEQRAKDQEAQEEAQAKLSKPNLASKRRPKTTETEPVAMEKTVAGWEEADASTDEATFRVEE